MLKKIELYLALISVVTFVSNLFLFSFASEILIVCLGSLSMLYLYFSFALLNNVSLREVFKEKALKTINSMQTVEGILTGGALSMAIISILFKVLDWPMASTLAYVALPGILIAGIVAFMKFKKNKNLFYKGLLIRLWLVGSVVFVLNTLPQDALLDFKYRNHPEYLQAYKDWRANSDDEVILEKYNEEKKKLNQ